MDPSGVAPGPVLETDRYTVRLSPATVTTDVAEFEHALQAGEPRFGRAADSGGGQAPGARAVSRGAD